MSETSKFPFRADSVLGLLMVVVISSAIAFVLCFRLEIFLKDGFVTKLGPWNNPQDIVIITIDEDTLANLPYRSPVDRGFLADVIGKIDSANPVAIGIDLLIDQPSETDKDALFIKALELAKTPIVMGYATGEDGLNTKQLAYENASLQNMQKALVTLVRDDFDGTVRNVFTGRLIDGVWYPSFAAALAEHAGRKEPHPGGSITYLNDGHGNPFEFTSYPAHTVEFIPSEWFTDKLVLLGTGVPMTDLHATPFATIDGAKVGRLFGVFIHAHQLAQMISGDQILSTGIVSTILIVLALTLVAALIVVSSFSLILRMVLIVLIIAIFCFAAYALFVNFQLQIPIATPLAAAAFSSILLALGQWYQDKEQTLFIESAFSKYVSPEIVKRIVADKKTLVLGGEFRTVTYVFTDLQGFTSLSERMEPGEIALLLNDYLDKMCNLFVDANATIDKIVGDAVIGFFGAPEKQNDQGERAIKLALAIDRFSQNYTKAHREKGVDFGITRIGVHKGKAVIGNFGGSRFMDYTGIGDTVNTAARLEAANKYLGTRICISRSVLDNFTNSGFRQIGSLILKGKRDAVECVEPLHHVPEANPMIAAYQQAFKQMELGNEDALVSFENLVTKYPHDPLIKLHYRRLQQGQKGATIALN
ncbi:MAG: adenylate/guanylate cyclase domain-containing protein [Hyphomicrobiales bacterium]|nr:adenylate/guanylate cyclase domain-containing protein [Hyphomicrobiales bacterium]